MEPQTAASAEPTTALERIVVPEIVDIDIIRNSLGPSIDRVIARADSTVAKLAAGIQDDASMALAVQEAEGLRDNGKDLLKKWREEFYMDAWYRPGEAVREIFDPRIKKVETHIKTLMGHVSDYKARKEREATRCR